jgi:alcohol dehydrogenase
VPTTAGTGSEAQSFALICHPQTHQKMACGDRKASCKIAILDPELTLSLPVEITAATGMDAISHALESHVTSRRNVISQAFSRQAWLQLGSGYREVFDDPNDLEARGKMLIGASLAGMAIENSMLGAAHALANPLTARFRIAHGVAIGLMLPHVLRFNEPAAAKDYEELYWLFSGCRSGAPRGGGLAAVVESLRERAGLPSRLRSFGVEESALSALAPEAATQWTAQFNPRPVSVEDLEELYRCAW